MSKLISTIIILIISLNANSFDIRNDFHKGMFDEDQLTTLIESKKYTSNNLFLAYKGISKTMLADHLFMPTSKLSYFNKGKAELEKAIKLEPNNPEFRYLRLLIQLNAPFFLDYSSDINNDINLFTKNLNNYNISKEWKLKFITNLLAADGLTTQQKVKITTLKNKLK